MLFLLNDAVIRLSNFSADVNLPVAQVASLQLPQILRMGQIEFARNPQLQQKDPLQALRICALILSRAPKVNAALFIAPRPGCAPHEVGVRLANVEIDVMAKLYTLQKAGQLDPRAADMKVWRRLAA